MKAKRNRIIAVLLAVVMAVSTIPETALAADSSVISAEVQEAEIGEGEAASEEDQTAASEERKKASEEDQTAPSEEGEKTSEEDQTAGSEEGEKASEEDQTAASEEGETAPEESGDDIAEEENAEEKEEDVPEVDTEEAEQETDAVSDVQADSEYLVAEEYQIRDMTVTPRSYEVSLNWISDEYINCYCLLYTEDENEAFFPGEEYVTKNKLQAKEAVSYIEWTDVEETGQYNDKGEICVDNQTVFHGESALKPNTTYYYQLTIRTYNLDSKRFEYYFLTEPDSFTTADAIEKSEVTVSGIEVGEIGYGAAEVTFQVTNPNGELIAGTDVKSTDGGSISTTADAVQQQYDKENNILYYSCTVPLVAETATLIPQVTVYTGSAPKETVIDGESKQVIRESLDGKLDITAEAGSQSMTWIANIDPYYECDSQNLTMIVYFRRKGATSYQSLSTVMEQQTANITRQAIGTNTTYQYYIHISSDAKDQIVYYEKGSSSEPLAMTTTQTVTYEDTEFPDEVFRNYLKTKAGIGTDEQLTSDKLEKITSLSLPTAGDTPVKNIKGIQYLFNLKNLSGIGLDIESIDDIASLVNLESVNLKGNDISMLPDLSGMKMLTSLNLENNLLPESELQAEKLPSGIKAEKWIADTKASQRGATTRAVYAAEYYSNVDERPFFLKMENAKDRTYTCTVEIDDEIVGTDTVNYYSYKMFTIEDVGCDAGTYPVKVTVTDQFGKKWIDETKQIVFADQLPQDTQYVGTYADGAEVHFYVNAPVEDDGTNIQNMLLCDKEGNSLGIVKLQNARKYGYLSFYQDFPDYRYVDIDTYLGEISGKLSLDSRLAEGDYDIKVTLTDDTSYMVPDIVRVSSDTVITGISSCNGSDNARYEDCSDYVYLKVEAINLDASKLRPVLYSGEQKISGFVSVSQMNGYFLYKLQKLNKENYWSASGAEYAFSWDADDGYEYIDQTGTNTVYIDSGDDPVLFYHYNYKKGELEVFFDSTVPEGTRVALSVAANSTTNSGTEATGQGVVEGGRIGFQLKDTENSAYVPAMYKNKKLTFTFSGDYTGEYTYSGCIEWYNYYPWSESNTFLYRRAGVTSLDLDYATEGSYSDSDTDYTAAVYQSRVMVGEKQTVSAAKKTVDGLDGIRLTGTWSTETGLAAGEYEIRYAKGSVTIGSETLYVYDENTLYQSDQFTYFSGADYKIQIESEQLYGEYITRYQKNVSDEQAKEIWDQNYRLQIFDKDGQAVPGYEVTGAFYKDDYLTVTVTGLSQNTSGYYVRVTDKDGDPLKDLYSGETYYSRINNASDALGKYHANGETSVWFGQTSGDTFFSELYVKGNDMYPVTVTFYKPYSTDVVKSIAVGQQTSNWYSFTAEDLEGIAADEVYRAVAVSAAGISDEEVGFFKVKTSGTDPTPSPDPTPTPDPTPDPVPVSFEVPMQTAVVGLQNKLEDVALPDVSVEIEGKTVVLKGKWSDDSKEIALSSFSGEQPKTFLAEYADDAGEIGTVTKEVQVKVLTPSKVTVTAENTVLKSGDITEEGLSNTTQVHAQLLTATGEAIPDSFVTDVTWESSQTGKVSAEGSKTDTDKLGYVGTVRVTGNPGKLNADITAKITIKSGTASKSFTGKCTVQVVSEEAVQITFGSLLDQNGKSYTNQNGKYIVPLTDSSDASETQLTLAMTSDAKKLTLKSSDTGIVGIGKVTQDSDTKVFKAEISLKNKAGYVTLTATADDEAKTSQSVTLYVQKPDVGISSTSVTLNSNTDETSAVSIYPAEGYKIKGTPVFREEGAAYFRIAEDETAANRYLISLNENSPAKKATYKLKLAVTLENTENHESVSCVKEFTVKVVQTEPKVTVKQTAKVNLFYAPEDKNGNGALKLTSSASIKDVQLTGDAATDFSLSYDKENDTYVISRKTNTEKPNKKGTLEITFEGYKESFKVTKKINIATENKKAKVVLGAKSGTIYTGTGNGTVSVDFNVATAAGTELDILDDAVTVTLMKNPAGYEEPKVTVDGTKGRITFKVKELENAKADTAEIKVACGVKDIAAKFSIKVSDKTPSVVLDKKSVVLNRNDAVSTWEKAVITATVKDNPDLQVTVESVAGADTKAQNESGINFAPEEEQIASNRYLISLKEGNLPNKGTYKFYVQAKIDGAADAVKLPLTVKVVDVALEKAVKLSAKGSIDVLNRESTSIVYTPKLTNITGAITKVQLTGSASHLFDAQLNDDGNIVVTAKTGAALVTKYNYVVQMKLTLDSDCILTTGNVKLKVTQSKPKVTVSPQQALINNNVENSQAVVDITAQNKDGSQVELSEVRLTNLTDVFSYDMASETLTLNQRGAVAKGKTYTLKFEVKCEDAADNEKPLTVSCKVKVQ